jgi:hypothetical protein
VETFGVSLNAEGTCFYGMQIEAVMDRIKDQISLDHLSRLLVDVQQVRTHRTYRKKLSLLRGVDIDARSRP